MNRETRIGTSRRAAIGWIAAGVTLVLAASPATADTIWVNPDMSQIMGPPEAGPLAARAVYRVSNSNWDMLLDRDTSPGIGSAVGTRDLGDNESMNHVWFDFELSHQAGRGFSFSMLNTNTGSLSLLEWSGALPGSFNALSLESRATPPGNVDYGLDVRDLALNTGSTPIIGSFADLDVGSPAGGSTVLNSGFVFADFDLSTIDWTLSGSIRPSLSATHGNPQDHLRLMIDAHSSTARVVPEPTSAALVIAGLFLAVAARRKRA